MNPVLDLRRTVLESELPWGRENFGGAQHAQHELLSSQGFPLVDGEFELGRVLFGEFRRYWPTDCLAASTVPSLVVHGDRDSAVSYEVARQTAAVKSGCAFHTVAGSDHGFNSREREDEAISITVDWVINQEREQG